jgi:hypothetical protein
VRIECPICFGQHGFGKAGIADDHHRVEVMGFGTQGLALSRAQFEGAGTRRGEIHVGCHDQWQRRMFG